MGRISLSIVFGLLVGCMSMRQATGNQKALEAMLHHVGQELRTSPFFDPNLNLLVIHYHNLHTLRKNILANKHNEKELWKIFLEDANNKALYEMICKPENEKSVQGDLR